MAGMKIVEPVIETLKVELSLPRNEGAREIPGTPRCNPEVWPR